MFGSCWGWSCGTGSSDTTARSGAEPASLGTGGVNSSSSSCSLGLDDTFAGRSPTCSTPSVSPTENAATTLVVLGGIAIALFLGVSYLAARIRSYRRSREYHLARLSGSCAYYGGAGSYACLALAVEHVLPGSPSPLAALLARESGIGTASVQLTLRLVFSQSDARAPPRLGASSGSTAANVDSLIHLLTRFSRVLLPPRSRSFQSGWCGPAPACQGCRLALSRRRQRRRRDGNWGIVTAVVVVTSFAAGAWTSRDDRRLPPRHRIRRHYRGVERRLRAGAEAVIAAPAARTNTALLRSSPIDELTVDALWFVRSTTRTRYRVIHTVPRCVGGPGDQTVLVSSVLVISKCGRILLGLSESGPRQVSCPCRASWTS